MDQNVIKQLKDAGIDTTMEQEFPAIPIHLPETGLPAPVGEEVPVLGGKKAVALVKLKNIPQLYAGTRRPPSFSGGPTKEYVFFFALIERTAMDYCNITRQIARDEEFERIYRQLRRRPDGHDGDPLFSYIQAAARLYMSLRDVSHDEFEAVAQRLSQSARRFAEGPSSTNYFRLIQKDFT